ncbi:alpha-N-acetylgalactosamine-specific lectin-like [Hemitrygon akajei]|uniref:alpha-N-acetylgalactosamine-specific lectin-like n=1 Tax=Hemitrygon akajei TaxID=2704970 RepID=UPI003BF946AA
MQDAEEFCNNHIHSGHLASVSSIIHNNFIFNVVRAVDESKMKAWIGLNDISQEGNFTWIDGTDYTYRRWAGGQPDDYQSNEDCVQLDYFTGTPYWNDLSCDTNLGLVCAYKLHCV